MNFVNSKIELPKLYGQYFCKYIFKNDPVQEVVKGVINYESLNGENVFTTTILNISHLCESIEWLNEESNTRTPEEVKDLFKQFMKDTDFVEFAEEYGVKGWDELDIWLEKNV